MYSQANRLLVGIQKRRLRIVLIFASILIIIFTSLTLIYLMGRENGISSIHRRALVEQSAEVATPTFLRQEKTPTPTPTKGQAIAVSTFYVNLSGSNTNNGFSEDSSFKTIQKAIDQAQPGDIITLAPGAYLQDVVTKRSGTQSAPITIRGPKTAILQGEGAGRIFEVNHNYISLLGFTIDGRYGDPTKKAGYRDKLLYVQGKGVRSGVTGLQVQNMTFKNAGGECIRIRYFAQNNEISYSTILNCGAYDFIFNNGGKNGEGIYIGTAPEQLKDRRNPTTDPDDSKNNWVHHNTINTQGNECVDIKEGSSLNIVEFNDCTGQKDPESGGLDSRGNDNIFRNNTVYGNRGAGIRLGGDTKDEGINNDVYKNIIKDNIAGGIKIQRTPQGKICGNTMSGNVGGDVVGRYAEGFSPTVSCD